ncbi:MULTISPECIES: DUF3052 domain-containing protein [unclassified Nocardioides]|uniref:DUF3052 domain-containing protein n=1 Tax=unclassified Nocardioides TaxID=2615069 RepID=UPI00361A2042
MAGYSGTPLLRKLGVKDEHVVLLDGAPDGFELGTTGAHVVRRLPGRPDSLDVTLTFHTRRAALEARLPVLFERTRTAGMVWVCWPKQAAQRALGIDSDLGDGVVREFGLRLGWVDVKVAAVDDTWSGLKFVRRLADR